MSEAMQNVGERLAGIDITIVVMYMVGVFFLGSFFGKYVKDAGDFFVAGKALPFWAIGMSIVVSDNWGDGFRGRCGKRVQQRDRRANFDWIGSMPAMVFAHLFSCHISGVQACIRFPNSSAADTTRASPGHPCFHSGRYSC